MQILIWERKGLTHEKKEILRKHHYYFDRPFFRDSGRGLSFNGIGYDLAEVLELFYL